MDSFSRRLCELHVFLRNPGGCEKVCLQHLQIRNLLEDVVKESILRAVPEVKDVKLDDTVSEDLLEMARRILNHEIG